MLTTSIPFAFEIPFTTFHKAGEAGKERRIAGIISTEGRDRQGERVLQRGLDFSEFVSNGWFNDNHSKATTGVVGFPLKIEKRVVNGKSAHYVEGYLLEGHKPADDIWGLAQSLAKTKRRLGFSIEGSVLRRSGPEGKVIAEAKVREVAITKCPVNTETGLEIVAKSLLAVEAEGEHWRRSMMAGQALNNPGAAPGQGFPLRTESMEARPQVTTRRGRKKIKKRDAVEFLKSRYRGMTDAMAERILNYVTARAAG